MIGYVKCFDNNKAMSFRILDYNLFKKHTKIWQRVSNLKNIEFDSEPVYGDNEKNIKTQVKIYQDKVNTNDCLSLIVLDSFIRVNKKYYPQTLLEECKYKIKKTERYNFINDELESDTEFGNKSESY